MSLKDGQPTVFGALLRLCIEPTHVVEAEMDAEIEAMLEDGMP